MQKFYMYILFNPSRTLYVGMTNDLIRRVEEHRGGKVPGFTAQYGLKQLAYYEAYPTAMAAIKREKQIKGWTRAKKIALIETANPHWEDLGKHLKERLPPNAVPDVSQERSGPDVPGQILRCAQDDGLRAVENPGNGTPSFVDRTNQASL
jgi:putative endonuclease